jgi:hypothetical protein
MHGAVLLPIGRNDTALRDKYFKVNFLISQNLRFFYPQSTQNV